jgi:hypothetical protein
LILRQPADQVQAWSSGQASTSETRILGDVGDYVAGRMEAKDFSVGFELCLGQDESVQRRIEDIDAERRDAVTGLGESPSGEGGGQVIVFGLGQVDVGDQALDRPWMGAGIFWVSLY